MPSHLDAFFQAMSEVSGVPGGYMKESGLMALALRGIERPKETECTTEEYQELLAKAREMAPQLVAELLQNSEIQEWARQSNEVLDSQPKVREAIASRALKASGVRQVKAWMRTTAAMLEYFRVDGEGWWHQTFGVGEDPEFTLNGVNRYLSTLPRERQWELKLALDTHEGSFAMLANAKWADQAFPVIQMGHKYAAALMSTKVPRVEIKPPWYSFMIEVLSGLLWTRDESGNRCPIALIHCVQHRHKRADGVVQALSFSAMSLATGDCIPPCLHRYNQTIEELQKSYNPDPDHDTPDYLESAFAMDLDGEDDRALLALTRLVLNTCLAMSNPEDVSPMGKHTPGWTRGPGRKGDPRFRAFKLGRDVTVDCRPALRQYLDGEKRSPVTVQFLVRGHWRHQACGEKFQARKLIWIEPHWKGPEEALILTKGHRLGDTETHVP